MPELVNISVGSLAGTSGAEGTTVWPRDWKNSRNLVRISAVFMQLGNTMDVDARAQSARAVYRAKRTPHDSNPLPVCGLRSTCRDVFADTDQKRFFLLSVSI